MPQPRDLQTVRTMDYMTTVSKLRWRERERRRRAMVPIQSCQIYKLSSVGYALWQPYQPRQYCGGEARKEDYMITVTIMEGKRQKYELILNVRELWINVHGRSRVFFLWISFSKLQFRQSDHLLDWTVSHDTASCSAAILIPEEERRVLKLLRHRGQTV